MRRYNRKLNSNRNTFDEARAFKADVQSAIHSIDVSVDLVNNALERFQDVADVLYHFGFNEENESFYLFAEYAERYLQALEQLAETADAAVDVAGDVNLLANEFLRTAGY